MEYIVINNHCYWESETCEDSNYALVPIYKNNPRYVNGVSESLFKQGLCLPSGPCVTDEDVAYIVQEIKKAIKK